MATQPKKWNKTELEALKPPASGRDAYHDPQCRNLVLVVTDKGTKTWVRYGRVHGKPKRIRIGTFPEWSIDNARIRCQVLSGEIAKGNNPAPARGRGEKTLSDAWIAWMDEHSKPNKRSWKKDVSRWNHQLKELELLKLSQLTKATVEEWHRQIGRTHPQAANLALKQLIAILNFACHKKNWCQQHSLAGVTLFPRVKRTRYLKPAEAPAFFEAIGELSPNARDCLLLMLMTGARKSNVCAMEWEEIDFAHKLWIVPTEKAKTKTPLGIALIDSAITLLTSRLGNGSRWVFPSDKSKSGHMTTTKFFWKKVVDTAGIAGLRTHDLRHTVASWQALRGVSLELIRQTLTQADSRSTLEYTHLDTNAARLSLDKTFSDIKKASEEKY